jgi:hypothetical protein
MEDAELAFAAEIDGRPGVVVNFGVYAGREATPAEVERLGNDLRERVTSLEVVCERRESFGPDRRAELYQVRVELPGRGAGEAAELVPAVESWARHCIAERRLMTP